MKTRKKFLVALLSVACLTAGALAFAACTESDGSTSTDSDIVAVYNAYAQSAGESALSYDEWLATIKGEKGETGASAYDIAVGNGFDGTEKE